MSVKIRPTHECTEANQSPLPFYQFRFSNCNFATNPAKMVNKILITRARKS